MKQIIKYGFPVITLLISWQAFAQQNQPVPVSLENVGKNLYEVRGGSGANGGLFIGKYGVLLIDAKMDKQSMDQLFTEAEKLTDKPIRFMVNTHSDGDHVNGNKFLPESVTIIAHENCRKEFFHPGRNGEPSAWNNPELAAYIPSVTFTDRMELYVDPQKIELWYFGLGHTTGDIVVYFPEDKVAFIGDQIFKGRPQLIHSYKGGSSFEHVLTLEKMLGTLDAQIFCSGHTVPVGRDMIQAHIAEMKELQNKVTDYMYNNYTLESIKKEFNENQAALIETIYNESLKVK